MRITTRVIIIHIFSFSLFDVMVEALISQLQSINLHVFYLEFFFLFFFVSLNFFLCGFIGFELRFFFSPFLEISLWYSIDMTENWFCSPFIP